MKKLLLFIGCSAIIGTSFSQLSGWNNWGTIDVTEASGADQLNKQYQITFNSSCLISLGLMNADGSDIRIGKDVNGSVLYDFYVMSGMNTTNTKVLVEIDTLLSNQTNTLYLFHGNTGATTVSSTAFLGGANSATDSVAVSSTGTMQTGWLRGFGFTTTADMLVPNMGSRTTNGGSYHMSIWDAMGNLLTQSLDITNAGMQYFYDDLDSAIILSAGTEYTATIFSAGSSSYQYGSSTQIGQHMTYIEQRYDNNTTSSSPPTSTLAGLHYGLVDFHYFLLDLPGAYTYNSSCAVNTVGINETALNNENVILSPNPAKNKVNLQFEKPLNNALVDVLNMHGQIVIKNEMVNNQFINIDIAELSNGIYFIKIASEEVNTTIKFIKN